MRRFFMTFGSTAIVLGSSLIAAGQDKGQQAPLQAPDKQAPLQAPDKQAPLQAPMQAPAKQAPMQAPAAPMKQAPLQAPSKQAPLQAPMQAPSKQAPLQARLTSDDPKVRDKAERRVNIVPDGAAAGTRAGPDEACSGPATIARAEGRLWRPADGHDSDV